jgi:streptogramin lyase
LRVGIAAALTRAALAGSAAATLAACSGAGSLPTHGAAQPASHARGAVKFTIAVPKASAAAHRRAPRYVSPATVSTTVDIVTDPGGSPVVQETVGLTPTSQGCSSTLASTICTLSLSLAPGSYDATVSTADASANTLSAGQLLDFSVTAGQTSTIALVLNGVPTALQIVGTAPAIHGTQSAGFFLYGAAPESWTVRALDADGNIIVGVGAPTFTVAASSGSGFSITNPSTTTPNVFSLNPPGVNGQAEIFALTAAYPDSTCTTSGAVCSATFAVTNVLQNLFVGNLTSVTEYAYPWYGAPTVTISTGIDEPTAMVMDKSGDLIVANLIGNDVEEYQQPYTGAPTTIGATSVDGPTAMVLDPSQNLFVANSSGGGTVTEYAPPYTGTPTATIRGLFSPQSLVLDAYGDLFVSNYATNTVTEYTPPYGSTPAVTISNGVNGPFGIAMDTAGDLFVANYSINTVTEYAPPYTGAPVVTMTGQLDEPYRIVLDQYGDVFVSNIGSASGNVQIFAPPYTGTPTVVHYGTSGPENMAFDGLGDLWVTNNTGSTVTGYPPPYSGNPGTITTGILHPDPLLFSP